MDHSSTLLAHRAPFLVKSSLIHRQTRSGAVSMCEASVDSIGEVTPSTRRTLAPSRL